MPSSAVGWQSLAHDVQGLLPFPLPTPPADEAVAPENSPGDDGSAPVETADALPAADQHPVEAFCEQVPADPDRCAATVVDAGVGAAIGAGIGAAVSAPVAIPAALVGAAAGFVVGIPFLPTGVVVGPLVGAAVGAAVVVGPATVLGGALGAAVGTIVGITSPLPPVAGLADALVPAAT